MPQTSPMNWLIISISSMMVLSFMASKMNINGTSLKPKNKNLNIAMKWSW